MTLIDAELPTVTFYRGGYPDNTSGKVVQIDFKSGDQVRAFSDAVSSLVHGPRRSAELSQLMSIKYAPSVRSFVLCLEPHQFRDNLVTVREYEPEVVSVEWAGTEDAWLDVVALLEPLTVKSGGHQYLASGDDGAEIVAQHYK